MANGILVIYYSLQGNTRFIAEGLAEELGADLIRLTTEDEPQGKSTLKSILWLIWQRLCGKLPTLDPLEIDMQDYSKIVLGSPVWGGRHALPLETFFRQYQLLNKEIALFLHMPRGWQRRTEGNVSTPDGQPDRR